MARDIVRRVQAKRKALDLDIEATVDLELWLSNAPPMNADDVQWVATETRAAACVVHDVEEVPPHAEHFEVDGALVHCIVS